MGLLLVPLLPLEAIFGEIVGGRDLAGPGEWLLGSWIFLTVAWMAAMWLPAGVERGLRAVLRRAGGAPEPHYVAAGLAILAVLLAAASHTAFDHRPLSIDSIVQLFQARILAGGRLWAPAPEHPAFFITQHMLVDGGRWYSQYPPGHPALLAIGAALGAAWVVPIALTLGAALALYAFTRRIYGGTEARILLFLLLASPFFWVMGASHMNHVSALAFVAGFAWLFVRWEDGGSPAVLAAAGASLGLAALSRPVTALAVGTAFAGFALPRLWRERRVGAALAGLGGFAAAAALYLAWNAATTGDPLLAGYVKLWGSSHGLGFHESPWGDPHTPLAGLRNQLTDLALLDLFLFEWPIPALYPVALFLVAGWAGEGWDRRLVVAGLSLPAAYFFYWHRDGYLGPRFLYETVAFFLPLTARALPVALRRLRGRWLRLGSLFRPVDAARGLLFLLALLFAWSLTYGVPGRFRAHASSLASMRLPLVPLAEAAGIDGGVLFVGVSWGNRLLATAQGVGVPASLVQKAYRRTDHCELDSVLHAAVAEEWPPARLEERLARLIAEAVELEQPTLNLDPSLRLRPGVPLTPHCADEIRYDREGYTLYAPHLLANEPELDGRFVVARDLRGQNERLLESFPGRPAWLLHGRRFVRLR